MLGCLLGPLTPEVTILDCLIILQSLHEAETCSGPGVLMDQRQRETMMNG